MKNTITFRKTFTNCDDFASYVLDNLCDLGYEVTEDVNIFLNINMPIGYSLFAMSKLPNVGRNYNRFGTVRSWLYDIYELKLSSNL
ncbi:hypothetical protein ACMGDK_11630 [Chryseobacterium sp. DT-3]|uniref:hypothetical protein n=1 Tax=Chryseobacterium sp. DT-3 TaxID=3396164 RepID=UPI003F1B0022